MSIEWFLNVLATGIVLGIPSAIISFAVAKISIKTSVGMFEQIIEKYTPLANQLGKILGSASGESRQTAKAEKMIMGDIMASQAPEIAVLKSVLSGETMEYLEENPHVLFSLWQKYEPFIKDLMAKRGFGKQNPKSGFEL